MVPPNGLSIRINGVESQEFNVQPVAGEGAVIETVFNGDDYVFTSRYILKGENVSPIMFRSYGPGHAMMGFLFALIFCYIFFAILRGVFKEHPSETP